VRALNQGVLAPELATLTDPNVAENAVAAIRQNPYARAAEWANVRELAVTSGREQSGLTPFGEELQAEVRRTEGYPWFVRAASFVGNLPNLVFPEDQEAEAYAVADRIQHQTVQSDSQFGSGAGAGFMAPVIINNYINNNPIYHGEDPRAAGDAHSHDATSAPKLLQLYRPKNKF